jgi:hypothetical protein
MQKLRALSVLLSLLLVTSYVFAQSPLGTVTGIATDASSAPIANAQITLVNNDTGVKAEATTNASGVYNLPNLGPGKYKLTANAQGFRPLEIADFDLAAYRTVRQDLHFEVASASTEVTVSAAASSVLQVDSPAIDHRLSSKQILELPTNLRSIYNNSGDSGLIFIMMPLTVPGIVQVGAGAAWLVPGSGANGVKLQVDGIETNFGNFGSPDTVSQPSLESIEEFTANILTTRAEFGGQGTVTTVTRSGTNQFHGNFFEYARNSAFDARNAFAAAKPFQNIHNYGASGGGPLIKDKTFFFITFDGTRGSRAYLFTSNVPTLAQRQGDFTGSAALKNPYTGINPFDGNRILPANLSPQALQAQQLFFPLPNFGPPTLTAGNYRAAFNGPEVHHIFELRLDHHFTSAHSAFARYENKKDDYQIPGARSALPPGSVGTSTNIRRVNFFTAGDVYAIRPNIYNEFRAGVVVLVSASDADLKGQTLIDKIGIQGLGGRAGIKGVPNIGIAGLSTVTQTLLNPVNDGHAQASDNLTWVMGKHTLKFGVEFLDWFVNRYLPTDSGLFGNFSFTNKFTGNPYADFLLGLPTSVTREEPYPTQYNRFKDWSFYGQDDYKVTQKLTLSYGLRYEYNGPVTANDGNLYSFDLASGSVVIPNERSRALFSRFFPATIPVVTASAVGLPESLRKTDLNNFAPRFGFSYQLGTKTVVRGGAGIYYGHFSGQLAATLAAGPYAVNTTSTNAFVNGQPLFTFQNPFAAPSSPGSLNLNGISPHLLNSLTTQYSFTIERELSSNIGLRVSYIGSKGSQLPYQRNVNQPLPSTQPFSASRRPYPLFNNITYADNGANSLYSGLQTQVQKRFTRGLMFSSAWTWAKYLSEVDDTGSAELNTTIENAYDRRRDRGNVYAVPRHQWENQGIYELHGTGKLRGGWAINALLNVSTGNFLTPVNVGPDPSNTNVTTTRPDVSGNVTYPKTTSAWFDRTVYVVPASGHFGNAAHNSIVGPGYVIFNLGAAKTVRFERLGQVQFAASFQNVLNHTNLGQPLMTVNNVNGGSITSTHIFPPAGSPRTGQLSLRYSF